ncbi:MAG: nucleotide excision repair endonuclease [Calditrichaeota bacterium]|nr:MAG: nucleotide excision repair endonuclease [Calditrichota bacterium]
MKNKIYKFLKQHGGSASALAIARAVLHLQSGSFAAAESLLTRILGADPRFQRDGVGNWFLNPEFEVSEVEDARQGRFWVMAFATDEKPIYAANEIQLAFVEIFQQSIQSEQTFTFFLKQTGEPTLKTWQRLWSGFDPNTILVAEEPAKVRNLIRLIGSRLQQTPPALWEIKLGYFAQQVLKLTKKASRSQLCRLLGLTEFSAVADLLSQARALADIWLALLEKIETREPLSLEALLALGQRPKKSVDFQSFQFSESTIRSLPEAPGVYLMKDGEGKTIYVGKAKNLRKRLSQYFLYQSEEARKLQKVLTSIQNLEWKVLDTELDARILEAELIQQYLPEINTQRLIKEKSTPQMNESSRIVITMSAISNKAIVYVLSPTGAFRRISCTQHRLPIKRIFDVVRKMCYGQPAMPARSAAEKRSCEIAWRWLQENRDTTNWLDAADYGSAEECVDKLLFFLHDFQRLRSKTILMGE